MNVTAHSIELVSVDGDRVTLDVNCSAGFYVRALAHDLGARLGIGAHLLTLRRTRSGDATLDEALGLDAIEREPALAARALVPLSRMLPRLSSVTLTSEGVRRATTGANWGLLTPKRGTAPVRDAAENGPYAFSSGCSIQPAIWWRSASRQGRQGFCTLPLFWCNMLSLLD